MGKIVLAVDDSASIRAMVAEVVRSGGYEVIEAVDGIDALAKAQEHDVALVLTDQNMPRLDGFGLVSTLRALPKYEKIPILVLTTEVDPAMKARGKAVGATGWLTKPFDARVLLDVIGKFVR
jgi:two-component system chemotaxis response regulator CheY